MIREGGGRYRGGGLGESRPLRAARHASEDSVGRGRDSNLCGSSSAGLMKAGREVAGQWRSGGQ